MHEGGGGEIRIRGYCGRGKWEIRLERKVRKAYKKLEISWRGARAVICGPRHFVSRQITGQSEQVLQWPEHNRSSR